MNETHRKGSIGELEIAADLLEKGLAVLRPLLQSARYDLVGEFEGRFYKVQCKYRRVRNGVIEVPFATGNESKWTPYNVGDFDVMAVYCPDTDRCYYLNASDCSDRTSVFLRTEPAANNQRKGVNWANDYLDFPYHAVVA